MTHRAQERKSTALLLSFTNSKMKPSDKNTKSSIPVASSSNKSFRSNHSRPGERDDVSIASNDKVLCDIMLDDSIRDQVSKDSSQNSSKEGQDGDSSIRQKFRPVLQLFFEQDRDSKSNTPSTHPGTKSSVKGKGSIPSAHEESARQSDEDDSVWKHYRRDTLSSIETFDPSQKSLRRRSSFGVVKGIDLVGSKGSSHQEKNELRISDTSLRTDETTHQKRPWYKNKLFLVSGSTVLLIIFCLTLASSSLKRTNTSAASDSSNISYNQEAQGGTKTVSMPQPSKYSAPSKQPSADTGNTVPFSSPVINTKPTVSGSVSVPAATVIKTPTKSPVTQPTNVLSPTTPAMDIDECFVTSQVTCTDANNPSISCNTLISNWKNKGSTPCVYINIRYNFRVCNNQADATALLQGATGKLNGIQTELVKLGKNTVMYAGECRYDYLPWSGKVFCYDNLVQNESVASLWIKGVSSKGSNCTDFNKFIYTSL